MSGTVLKKVINLLRVTRGNRVQLNTAGFIGYNYLLKRAWDNRSPYSSCPKINTPID